MKNKIKSGVYRFICLITNKQYIGSSINFNKRKNIHLRRLRKNEHHSIIFQRAFNLYGEEAFIFEVLELVSKLENEPRKDFGKRLVAREQSYLDLFGAQEFIKKENNNFRELTYNIFPTAGSNLGSIRSIESINKYINKLKNHPEIIEKQKIARKKTLFENPNISKLQAIRRKETYDNDPSIQERANLNKKQTLLNNPEILKKMGKEKSQMYKDHPEILDKIRNTLNKTLKDNPEINIKNSKAQKLIAINAPILQCIHCKKFSNNKRNMLQWHGDNCKLNPNFDIEKYNNKRQIINEKKKKKRESKSISICTNCKKIIKNKSSVDNYHNDKCKYKSK
jgi:group I intron endonuclease